MRNDSSEDQNDLRESVLGALTNSSPKTLSAQEIARVVVADESWPSLLMPIRRAAVELALAGRLVIYRKGKPVDPTDFKGVYRLGLPRHD
jgi:hypothetical protein